jgi:hypothetical protein
MATKQDCCAEWRPELPATGLYEVRAFIPSVNATSGQARYQITHRRGTDVAIVDQARFSRTRPASPSPVTRRVENKSLLMRCGSCGSRGSDA